MRLLGILHAGALDAAVAIGARRPRNTVRVSADNAGPLCRLAISCLSLHPVRLARDYASFCVYKTVRKQPTPRLHLHHPSGPATALGRWAYYATRHTGAHCTPWNVVLEYAGMRQGPMGT